MEQERSQELQQNLTGEALAMLAMGANDVDNYEQAIRIIGAACGIPEETTGNLLGIIRQGKEAPKKIDSGEITLENKKDVMANWKVQDTFWVLMDLFLVSLGMKTQEEREAMYHMAEELIATQNFDEWLNGDK